MKLKSTLLLGSLSVFFTVQGQWIQQTSPLTVNLFSVYFTDAKTGYAVGDEGTILKTTNGGSLWLQQDSGIKDNETLYSVFFPVADTGYTAGTGEYETSRILKTTNGGANWVSQYSGTNNDLLSVCFSDSHLGIAVGYNGTVLNTIDGGQDWLQVEDFGGGNHISSVFFSNKETGFAVYNEKIIRSTNSGKNWYQVNSGLIQNDNLYAIFFPNASTGYAVGTDGITNTVILLKTINGGDSWTKTNLSTATGEILTVYFTDINTGYAAGTDGQIIKTKDGGNNWVAQNAPTYNTIFSIYFPTPTIGYAVGANGTILKISSENGIEEDSGNLHGFLSISPNPFNDNSEISYKVPKSGLVHLSLYNVEGNEILILDNQIRPAGNYRVKLNLPQFPNGVYYCKLLMKTGSEVIKILKAVRN